MDAVEYMNSLTRWEVPPPSSPQWEQALARACDIIVSRDVELLKLRKIMSHVPGLVALQAKEAAGYGVAIKLMEGE